MNQKQKSYFIKLNINKIILFIVCIIVLLSIFSLLISSNYLVKDLKKSIENCLYIIIPALFPFMILSNFIMNTKVHKILFFPFYPITKYILKIDPKLSYIIILSMIGGYPIGAKLIRNLIDNKTISLKTANRMICFCYNSGPSFLIGALSIPIFNNIYIGLIIFASHTIASLIIGFFISVFKKIEYIKQENTKELSFSEGFVSSVSNAIKTISITCGFILTFAIIISILNNSNIINIIIPIDWIKNLFTSFLEVSYGINNLFIHQFKHMIPILVFLTSIGGVCLLFQIYGIFLNSGISLKLFFITRLFHGIISIIITNLFITNLNISIETFNNYNNYINTSSSTYGSISLIILSIFLLLSIYKDDIIIKKKFHKRNK
ncbi:MAG: hypothetical protein KFW09_02595 [Oscillospiraceae bacterium]|nr:hypothetical protein [Oscillospiraceae bacterium]